MQHSSNSILIAPKPKYILHGTPKANFRGILERGINFLQHEPSFTTDLVHAGMIYAHPINNPHSQKSGDVVKFANELVLQGIIHSVTDNEDLLNQAREYCRHSGDYGTVFVITTRQWQPAFTVSGSVRVNSKEKVVRGSFTKWIGSYVTLYRESVDYEKIELFANQFKQGSLYSNSDFYNDRLPMVVPASSIVSHLKCDGRFLTLMGYLEDFNFELVDSWLFDDPDFSVTREILNMTLAARLCRVIRKIAISVLFNIGYQMVKTDVKTHYLDSPNHFWASDELNGKIKLLLSRQSSLLNLGFDIELILGIIFDLSRPNSSDKIEELFEQIDILTYQIFCKPFTLC